MSSNQDRKSSPGQVRSVSCPNETKTLGFGVGISPGGIKDMAEFVQGSEGRVNIIIANRMSKDIDIHLQGGTNKEKREKLKKEMSRVFSKKPKDGLVTKATHYECEFWWGDKHAKMFVYGNRAPRCKNLVYEVREDGIFLILQQDHLLQEWEDY